MTYYVNDKCVMCKHTDCVEVCPVDCFYEGENFLAIKPDECIDCGVCEPECPVDAIRADTDTSVPKEEIDKWVELNTKKQWQNMKSMIHKRTQKTKLNCYQKNQGKEMSNE